MEQEVNADPNRPDPPLLSHTKEARHLHRSLESSSLMLSSQSLTKYLQTISHPCSSDPAAPSAVHHLRACLTDSPRRQLTIDGSPRYWFSPYAPYHMRFLSPRTKVIIMLREPLERTESLYVHRSLGKHKWQDASIDALFDSFMARVNNDPGMVASLERLKHCTSVECQEQGWRDLVALGGVGDIDMQLFSTAFYRYGLAAWRRNFFQAGRVMVVDSHAYYRDRVGVMEQVIKFLYGREMTEMERAVAQSAPTQNTRLLTAAAAASSAAATSAGNSTAALPSSSPARSDTAAPTGGSSTAVPTAAVAPTTMSTAAANANASSAVPGARLPWQLSPDRRSYLTKLYNEHVLDGLQQMLDDMRKEGAWVLGFDQAPWPQRRL
ncbi:hypothetical protein HYH03_004982 [Edaphochlamys debaryana]|uniref:Sulfotransferase n=1 Tax=Edaphochlamys debaryana TaxID=47281 RepID=A0A836C1J5_9CHLO|nr:hypothetical protein HYH03_004982 [Edaphochlamys debaryana]|eukprot:KAG2496976.1 hypothetical protein HYH03_004982 [Edaphochlamys debaryana]